MEILYDFSLTSVIPSQKNIIVLLRPWRRSTEAVWLTESATSSHYVFVSKKLKVI